MNSKKLKQIKNVVANLKLVKSIEEYEKVTFISGADLRAEKQRAYDELPEGTIGTDKLIADIAQIDVTKMYRRKYTTVRALNHVDKLKKFYLQHKDDCIREYMKWLEKHHLQMVKKYPSLFEKRQDVTTTNTSSETNQ